MSIDIQSHKKTHANSLEITLTDNSVIELVSAPEGTDERLHIKIRTPHPVKKVVVTVEEIE